MTRVKTPNNRVLIIKPHLNFLNAYISLGQGRLKQNAVKRLACFINSFLIAHRTLSSLLVTSVTLGTDHEVCIKLVSANRYLHPSDVNIFITPVGKSYTLNCLDRCEERERERERERDMFYLTTHSTHFIYGYMASDIWLRTILIVRKETRCRHIGGSYRVTARVLPYAPRPLLHQTWSTGWNEK